MFGQTGTLRGTVTDASNGETVIGATVVVEGTTTGTSTDLDGNFSLEVAPGTYTFVFSSISFADKKVSDVVIKEGEVTILNVSMQTSTEEITEVVISATKVRDTDNALLTVQRKSPVVLDAVSSQTISRTGDSDAAGALKRVPGVSVEGGKYVYVRGLGDRYTKTTLNGMDIPGLDPDRNTVQMDVFPTALVDNITVYKTFSPDLPGDFTGGVVDIVTKSFPEKRNFQVGGKWGYNTATTFKKNYILYKGGKLDWLGFDDGTRKLPFSYNTVIDDGMAITRDPKLEGYTRSFSRELEARQMNNFFNQSYNVSFGNQYPKGHNIFGLNMGFTYKNTYEFYEDAQYGEHQHDPDPTVLEFDPDEYRVSHGPLGIHNVLWSGLVAGAFKTQNHRTTLQIFHTQNGEATASSRSMYDGFDVYSAISDILTYQQRSITNFLVTDRHRTDKYELELKNSFTLSSINDPDLRVMQFSVANGDTVLEAGGSSQTNRYFRDLNEFNENFRADMDVPFRLWNGADTKLSFGIFDTYKRRNFTTYIADLNNNSAHIHGGANWLLEEQNIWTAATGTGTYVTGSRDESNTFESSMNVLAAYIMNELPLHQAFKIIYGVRMEKSDIIFTGQKQQIFNPSTDKFTNKRVLNEIDFLPSVNIVSQVIENMNFRVSYARTLARPTFKEKSLAQIFDPITETTFIGNLDLQETQIDNVDFRWEYFFNIGEMVSVSAFFKNFNNPIEITVFDPATPRDLTPRNVDNAKAYGVEFELRKNFKFISEKLEGLMLSVNLTWVKSVTTMSPQEYQSRLNYQKVGETIKDTRELFGQSPYLVNTSLSYTSTEIGLTATIAYNVQGKRLVVVGGGRAPDVYEDPFHSLNLKLSKGFGKKDQYRISVAASNLVGDVKLRVYESNYGATPQDFQRLVPGRTFSVGFNYTLN